MAGKIKLPGKTVVCGGHATFLKELKPRLSGNVKYIQNERGWDTTVIKGADSVWLQTNAMNHGQYVRVLKYAKLYNVPVRYFQYASAQKCAMQMAEA